MKPLARLSLAGLALLAGTGAAPAPDPVPPPDQAAQYAAEATKTILELQPFRRGQTLAIESADGHAGEAMLVELNPDANAWLLLTLDRGAAGGHASYHLQNPEPLEQRVALTRDGLAITAAGQEHACSLWSGAPDALQQAAGSALPYAPLCDDRLYLRNPVAGHRTDLERITDFLRDHVGGGDAIVGFVRDSLFGDAWREEGRPGAAGRAPDGGGPLAATLSAAANGVTVVPEHLGIAVAGAQDGALALGGWYPALGLPGIHLSVIRPQAVAEAILASHPERANPLDGVEARALDYLVAFDLADFDVGFALGSDHPRLGWSPRPPEAVRPAGLPGPDGIGSTAPLVTNGMVAPTVAGRTVATFTGGFKREHGAFKYGDLAGRNHGSHYGFVEEGVIFSKLQPGLATLYVLDDGTVDMKTWQVEDGRQLGRLRYARQNGVALVEPDPDSGLPAPGPLVARWGPGNWSGSASGELRALRAGACLQESAAGRYLIYGWFSTATPSAMARVFQAFGCRYAMLLDMNALEHTYLALYPRQGDEIVVEHLISGMAEVDEISGGRLVPRFIGFPDNRDFFYLTRKETRP